jgi:sodium-independent sulfate anion transporter 11
MPGENSTKVGHALAKGLGIKVQYRDPLGSNVDPVTRGESTFSSGTAERYIEEEPTTAEYLVELIPTLPDIGHYFYNLFPFLKWITRYNWQWFWGDLVAGEFSLSRRFTRDETSAIYLGATPLTYEQVLLLVPS